MPVSKRFVEDSLVELKPAELAVRVATTLKPR
jgi:hypothetical protein